MKDFIEKELLPYLHASKFTATNRQFQRVNNLIKTCQQLLEQLDKDAVVYIDPTAYKRLQQGMYRSKEIEIPVSLVKTERFSLELKGNYNVTTTKETP